MFDMAETLLVRAEPSQPDSVARISLTATGIRADPLAQCANSSRASPSASAPRLSSCSLRGQAGSTRPSSRRTTGACGRCATSGCARRQPLVIPTSSSSRSTTRRSATSRSSSAAGRGRARSTAMLDRLPQSRRSRRSSPVDVGFWEPEREAKYYSSTARITSAQSDQRTRRRGATRRQRHPARGRRRCRDWTTARCEQKQWKAPPYRLGPAIEERPVVTLPYPALAVGCGGLRTQLHRDRSATVPRAGFRRSSARRPLHAVARRGCCARRRGLSARGCRARRRRDSGPRSAHPARSVEGHGRTGSVEAARAADDADQLPSAGARRRQAALSRRTRRRCC